MMFWHLGLPDDTTFRSHLTSFLIVLSHGNGLNGALRLLHYSTFPVVISVCWTNRSQIPADPSNSPLLPTLLTVSNEFNTPGETSGHFLEEDNRGFCTSFKIIKARFLCWYAEERLNAAKKHAFCLSSRTHSFVFLFEIQNRHRPVHPSMFVTLSILILADTASTSIT